MLLRNSQIVIKWKSKDIIEEYEFKKVVTGSAAETLPLLHKGKYLKTQYMFEKCELYKLSTTADANL